MGYILNKNLVAKTNSMSSNKYGNLVIVLPLSTRFYFLNMFRLHHTAD